MEQVFNKLAEFDFECMKMSEKPLCFPNTRNVLDFCSLPVRTEVNRILMAFRASSTGTEGFFKVPNNPGRTW